MKRFAVVVSLENGEAIDFELEARTSSQAERMVKADISEGGLPSGSMIESIEEMETMENIPC